MKVRPEAEMGQVPDVVCRQSRLRGIIGGLVVCGFLVGMTLLFRDLGAPWLMWVGTAVLAALCVPMFVREALVRFRSTNWVLQVHPDGLWINLRPLEPRLENGAGEVLYLGYREIARVHRHIDTWTTPSDKGVTTHWRRESLEVHLASDDLSEVSPALAEVRASGKRALVSFIVPAPGVIRIAWRGFGLDVVPGLGRVLAQLDGRVPVSDPTRASRPDWSKLSDDELDELVEELARWGDGGANDLLIRRRGCSATEAHKLVEQLSTRG